ncbi:MAG: tryptophan 7-halogenase [Alphaproteobacteria bacterium]|nr:tryptophan 7-halogenase [Alphaproteobacteria bacterium]
MPETSTGIPFKKIVIVGGGTAGWMTAALLSKFLTAGYEICLVESEEIGTIGVGEATIPAIKIFNRLLAVDQAEVMKATQASFKLGIEFADWRRKNHTYIHGFGKIGKDLLWLRTHQFWLKMFPRGGFKDFDFYSINALAARKGRFGMGRADRPNSPLADIDYAYHFDASLYARYLRAYAEQRRVKRVEGKIVRVKQRPEDGFIASVVLQNGREIPGELFIDCSGIRALLIGQTLGIGYDAWNRWLLCDRALAVPCASAPELLPYTRSTARDAGWQWRIPLQHRIGNGLVYSSSLMDDDGAARALFANLDGAVLAEPRLVKFTPGKRRKTWEKNCVAIGLSSGFLEPLESTSIHLIQTAILRLVALFPGRGFPHADTEEFNRLTDFEYVNIRDFIIAHYKVTEREDTPFWAYCKHMDIPDALRERLTLFKSTARFFKRSEAELFREESWVQVLLGQGLNTGSYDPMVDLVPEDQIVGYLKDIEDVIADTVDTLPRHGDYIAQYCRAVHGENASA